MSAAEGGFPSSGRWGKTAARESERDTYGGRERQKRERERERESIANPTGAKNAIRIFRTLNKKLASQDTQDTFASYLGPGR